ncbi:uncharacterized protein NDAI_0A00680 [Naumovozyma dairenensis CBS 421]|uniref:Uncharacterized protein n=1 Tax=Naumovozyma dairenensis (strain ATCC 10597 / BCRC 20456 / CBS 421 / NBRC 0211 / NRRL Y-12639) TaxID=1071378 RepID=G0W338_NAUDC|nr:hypothetical protein NDAI_0A00680 [Naumovozyma dairenensis CBS 421]CCD22226.1 hypothetical protein NDAI_0A00680 [Naumovozyma dairenensis CBS 421]
MGGHTDLSDCIIQVNKDNNAIKGSLNFVPIKIHMNDKTKEFSNNFIVTNTPIQLGNNKQWNRLETFLRGAKLIGTDISLHDNETLILSQREIQDNDSLSTTCDPKQIYVVDSTIDKMLNFEREGNEQRIEEELNKFYEYIQLNNLLHNNDI